MADAVADKDIAAMNTDTVAKLAVVAVIVAAKNVVKAAVKKTATIVAVAKKLPKNAKYQKRGFQASFKLTFVSRNSIFIKNEKILGVLQRRAQIYVFVYKFSRGYGSFGFGVPNAS